MLENGSLRQRGNNEQQNRSRGPVACPFECASAKPRRSSLHVFDVRCDGYW